MNFAITAFKCGNGANIVVSIPSFAPDASHSSLGTRMKSAILGSARTIASHNYCLMTLSIGKVHYFIIKEK